jgi:hypothetical protein
VLFSIYSAVNFIQINSDHSINDSIKAQIIFSIRIPNIAYVILFIWQIFNAGKLAKKFDEIVRCTGKEPW